MEAGLPLLCAKARGCRWFRKTSHYGCLELEGPERIGHILDDSLSKAVRQPRFVAGQLVLQRGFDTLDDRLLARSKGAIQGACVEPEIEREGGRGQRISLRELSQRRKETQSRSAGQERQHSFDVAFQAGQRHEKKADGREHEEDGRDEDGTRELVHFRRLARLEPGK